MKIKRKVEMNLPQLIEWVEKNRIRNHVFISDIDRNEVEINIHGCIFCKYITLKDTFTVTVEEEITEDTELKSMVEVTTDDLFAVWEHASISTWKNEHSKEFHAYIDGEFKLIWTREKGLVE